ncbi:MAG TPA: hypothetical protein VJ788_00320 [Gemmatimonadota bacterium]|nr:hypothetical protein [Gemmatimonadota bacterium]
MPNRSIEATLVAAGLVAGLAGTGKLVSSVWQPAAPADTLSAEWIDAVTMEPIRVVVPRDMLIEAVTMEPIRVVIPRSGMPPEASEER